MPREAGGLYANRNSIFSCDHLDDFRIEQLQQGHAVNGARRWS